MNIDTFNAILYTYGHQWKGNVYFLCPQNSLVSIFLTYKNHFPTLKIDNEDLFKSETKTIKQKHPTDSDLILQNLQNIRINSSNLFVKTSTAFENFINTLIKQHTESLTELNQSLQRCDTMNNRIKEINSQQTIGLNQFIKKIYSEVFNKPTPSNISSDGIDNDIRVYRNSQKNIQDLQKTIDIKESQFQQIDVELKQKTIELENLIKET